MTRSHRQGRVAFLLNANAKSVTKSLLKELSVLIPKEDLYLSHSLLEAEANITQILNKNYAYLFCGGGDGTVISAINMVNVYEKKLPHSQIPRIGVLGLGTGNALARLLHAKKPKVDIQTILSGKSIEPVLVSMIETESGTLTPFGGIGYDGELINDFESVKDVFFESPLRKFFSSVLGFSIAGFFKTLPRQVARQLPIVRVNSSYPSYRIMEVNGVDEEIYIEQGKILYDDVAPLICVGTIPSVGYGLTMFPFANKRPGYMQLRISAVPISVCLSNLYPSIWHGHFRHKKLYDFLVKDVTIESEESLPYQLGGDAMGYKKQLYFTISKKPVAMAKLNGRSKSIKLPSQPLLMPLI
jgi:diacylglycerol kinase family enzyme